MAMQPLLRIVEGWTAELGPFTLMADGVPINLTGLTVELELRPAGSTAYVDTAGNVRVDDDTTTGRVYYKPDAADFVAANSPYAMHWKVTDGDGNVVFFPNVGADLVNVYVP
jgi:hypothetical protein